MTTAIRLVWRTVTGRRCTSRQQRPRRAARRTHDLRLRIQVVEMSETYLREQIARSIGIGDDHYLHFYGWSPDRRLNPQYDGLADVEKLGATIIHRVGPNEPHPGYDGLWGVPGWCAGSVMFKAPETEHVLHVFSGATWDVHSWDPLHIEPSVLCGCGDHGFIRDGRWIPA